MNAKQEAEALRRENDNLRLEGSKLERQLAEMQAELSSAKVTIKCSSSRPLACLTGSSVAVTSRSCIHKHASELAERMIPASPTPSTPSPHERYKQAGQAC